MTTPRWKTRPKGSNWGDFGPDDRLGTLNHLTPERRLAALEEVREGVCFCLSLPLDLPGGSSLSPHRKPPRFFAGTTEEGVSTHQRRLSQYSPHFCDVVNDDGVTLYTQYSTQWDALAHFGREFDADGDGVEEAVFYNGYTAADLHGDDAATTGFGGVLGIQTLAENAVQGRGVLVNGLAAFGRERVRITGSMLLDLIDKQEVEVRPGDILCLYTGYADALVEQDRHPDAQMLRRSFGGLDGGDPALLDWITTSGIAAICADNPAVEYVSNRPPESGRAALLPLHEHCIFKLGMPLGELWTFKALAEALGASGRSSFLLTAAPLNLPGACGSPVTPVATI